MIGSMHDEWSLRCLPVEMCDKAFGASLDCDRELV